MPDQENIIEMLPASADREAVALLMEAWLDSVEQKTRAKFMQKLAVAVGAPCPRTEDQARKVAMRQARHWLRNQLTGWVAKYK